jgi:D-serine deaminase-like pyridoxal phosphate-dependent protein
LTIAGHLPQTSITHAPSNETPVSFQRALVNRLQQGDGVNTQALDGLREQHIGPDAKGMPPDATGSTIADLATSARHLFTGGFTPPLMVLHADALAHNLDLMARYCAAAGVDLAPHGKTTLAPQIFQRQLDHGAYGITAATGTQLRLYRAFGVPRVVLANQLVDPVTIAWLRAELDRDPGFEVLCYVDSPAGVELLATEFNPARTDRPLPVLLEVGHPGGRTGCRTDEQVDDVTTALAKAPGLRLAGVSAFEGTIASPNQPGARDQAAAFLADVRHVAQRLLDADLVPGELILSAGGSSYFDLVVDAFRDGWPAGQPVRVLLRSGCYVVHETGPSAHTSPLTLTPHEGESLRPALELWGQVLSRPEPELALVGFGRRDASFDSALPTPLRVRHADEDTAQPLHGASVEGLNDQHAYLRLPAGQRLAVGDWVSCGLAHPCTAFDKWRLIPVVDQDRVIDVVHTFF